MFFYFLSCFVIVTSAFPESHIDSENVTVSAEDGAAGRMAGAARDPQRGLRSAPYQVQISSRKSAIFCSGAILNDRYMVTAAHCVQGERPRDLLVRYGSNILGEGVAAPIEEIVQHPDYYYPLNEFDIAYIRTVEALRFDRVVGYGNDKIMLRSIAIASPNAKVPRELHVTGWGYQEDNQRKLSRKIQTVDLPVISNRECQEYYPMMRITKNMICLYNRRTMNKGICEGDGGNPATFGGGRRLVGVGSFSRGCGSGMGPSIFTYVDAEEIREFILNGTSKTGAQRPGHPTERPQRPSKRPDKHPYEHPEKLPNSPGGDSDCSENVDSDNSEELNQIIPGDQPSKRPEEDPADRPEEPLKRPQRKPMHRPQKRPAEREP